MWAKKHPEVARRNASGDLMTPKRTRGARDDDDDDDAGSPSKLRKARSALKAIAIESSSSDSEPEVSPNAKRLRPLPSRLLGTEPGRPSPVASDLAALAARIDRLEEFQSEVSEALLGMASRHSDLKDDLKFLRQEAGSSYAEVQSLLDQAQGAISVLTKAVLPGAPSIPMSVDPAPVAVGAVSNPEAQSSTAPISHPAPSSAATPSNPAAQSSADPVAVSTTPAPKILVGSDFTLARLPDESKTSFKKRKAALRALLEGTLPTV